MRLVYDDPRSRAELAATFSRHSEASSTSSGVGGSRTRAGRSSRASFSADTYQDVIPGIDDATASRFDQFLFGKDGGG